METGHVIKKILYSQMSDIPSTMCREISQNVIPVFGFISYYLQGQWLRDQSRLCVYVFVWVSGTCIVTTLTYIVKPILASQDEVTVAKGLLEARRGGCVNTGAFSLQIKMFNNLTFILYYYSESLLCYIA